MQSSGARSFFSPPRPEDGASAPSLPPQSARLIARSSSSSRVSPRIRSRELEETQKSTGSFCTYRLHDFEEDLKQCIVAPACGNLNRSKHNQQGQSAAALNIAVLDELRRRWGEDLLQLLQGCLDQQEQNLRKLLKEECFTKCCSCCQTHDTMIQTTVDEGALSDVQSSNAPSLDEQETLQKDLPADEQVLVRECCSETPGGLQKMIRSLSAESSLANENDIPPCRNRATAVGDVLRAELAVRRQSDQMKKCSVAESAEMVPSYGTDPSYWKQFQRFVRSNLFEYLSCFMSALNIFFYSIEVQVVAANNDSNMWHTGSIVQMTIFTAYFLIELVVRIMVYGKGFILGKAKVWNVIDSIVVAASFVDLILVSAKARDSLLRSSQVARMIRIFQIGKTVRVLRSLKVLVYSILGSMQQLFWTILLLLGLLYLFALILTDTANGHKVGNKSCELADQESDECKLHTYYGELPRSMLTLCMALTGGVDWSDAFYPLADIGFVAAMLFLTFLIFTSIAVMNVVTAIFCQGAMEAASRQQDMQLLQYEEEQDRVARALADLFRVIDDDDSGDLSLIEFEDSLQQHSVQASFESLELDVSEAKILFELLDVGDGEIKDSRINIDEFVDGCLHLRGKARNFDVTILRLECKALCERLGTFLNQWETYLKEVNRNTHRNSDKLETQ